MSTTNKSKANFYTLLVYSLGTIPVGIKNNLLGSFLLVYFNQVLGLSAQLAASAMAIALVVDAISDPLIGAWSDRVKTKWGRRHPFIYLGIVPFALFYYLILQFPDNLSESSLFYRLLFLMIGLRLSMTLYEVPRGALAPELTKDYDQRNQISGLSMGFGWIGGAGLATIAYAFFFIETVNYQGASAFLRPQAFQELAFWGGLGIFITSVISNIGLHSQIPNLHKPSLSKNKKSFLSQVLETLSNKSWIALFVSGCLYALIIGITTNAGMYNNIYFWQWTPSDIALFPIAAATGVIFVSILSGLLAKGRNKKNITIWLFITTIFLTPLPIVLRLIDPYFSVQLLPSNGTDFLWWILITHYVLETCLGTLGFIFIISMAMEIVEDVQTKTGRREEGLLGTANTLVQKLIGAGGVLIAGLIISHVGLDDPGSIESMQEPIRNFATIMIYTTMSLGLMATVALLFYDIDRKKHSRNIDTLGYTD